MQPAVVTITEVVAPSDAKRVRDARAGDAYEVLVDPQREDLYGWVAAAARDGVPWIEPRSPDCPGGIDGPTIAAMNRLDYFVCFGGSEVDVFALNVGADTYDGCPESAGGGCSIEPGWFTAASWLRVDSSDDEQVDLAVAVPPALEQRFGTATEAKDLVVTLAADGPEAPSCRMFDERGEEVLPRARAVVECRLRLVVREIAGGDPGTGVEMDPAEAAIYRRSRFVIGSAEPVD